MSNEQIPTPRTDALLVERRNQPDSEPTTWYVDDVAVFLKHARQLERELHEAKSNIAALQKIETDLRAALMDDSYK